MTNHIYLNLNIKTFEISVSVIGRRRGQPAVFWIAPDDKVISVDLAEWLWNAEVVHECDLAFKELTERNFDIDAVRDYYSALIAQRLQAERDVVTS